MIHYSFGLLVLYFAWRQRSARILGTAAAAVALGAGLAAFYLLPAIYEQRWIDVAQALSAGLRPADNFLFIRTGDSDHDTFNRLISCVATFEIVVLFACGWAARGWRETHRDVWNVLLAWAGACTVLLFPVTALLWKVLPKLQFMQFPWRWLLCLSMIFSTLVTVGLRRWRWRAAICALSILVIVVVWHRIQAPWWDSAGDFYEMQDNMESGAGYEGVDEYTPTGAEAGEIDGGKLDKDARAVTVNGPAHAAIHVDRWDAESRTFTAEMSASDRLALRLLSYPAWQVKVNGRVVEAAASGTGQMLVPVEAGMNRVQVMFVRTWDRTAGGLISMVTLLCLGGWFLMGRARARKRSLTP